MEIFDDRPCSLGEGPLWHPRRGALYWVDILGKRVLSPSGMWAFDEHVSALGWIDDSSLVVATETALLRLDLDTGARDELAPLEKDKPHMRSNDGRADPYGGFWIGTMAKDAAAGAGAFYRYYRGELRQLHKDITIPNATCFSPDGLWAYFCDTRARQILRQPLHEKDGWPTGAAEVWLDLRADGLNPDGAVMDTEGRLWMALWGVGRVACFESGVEVHRLDVPAAQTTCPAFGGPGLRDLFVTSAADGDGARGAGLTYVARDLASGQAEHRVVP